MKVRKSKEYRKEQHVGATKLCFLFLLIFFLGGGGWVEKSVHCPKLFFHSILSVGMIPLFHICKLHIFSFDHRGSVELFFTMLLGCT